MLRCYRALLMILCGCLQTLPAHAAEAADGRSVLLIASEDMADPRFRQSVVLVTRHGRNNSPIGIIVNRPLDSGLDRVFPELKTAQQHRLHYGGPVSPGGVVFLLRGEKAPAASIALAEKLFLSSDAGSLRQLLEASTPPDRLRVLRGFASWAPFQLESEIDRGDWHVLPVDPDALFNEAPDQMWPRLWRRATELRVRAPGSRLLTTLGDADYSGWQAASILGHP